MPKSLEQFKLDNGAAGNDLPANSKFTEIEASQLQDFVQALFAMRENLVKSRGKIDEELSGRITDIGRDVLDLVEMSLDAAGPQLPNIDNNALINDDLNIINTDSNNINNINNDNELTDDVRWRRVTGRLTDLNVFLSTNLNDIVTLGAVDDDAENKVDMNAFFTGLSVLKNVYDVNTDQASFRKTYDDRRKAVQPAWVLPSYESEYDPQSPKYKQPEPLSQKYTRAVNDIDSAIDYIHTNPTGIPDFRILESSSPEHQALSESADRLKKAFENPDPLADPIEKRAAIREALKQARAYRRKKRHDDDYHYEEEAEIDELEKPLNNNNILVKIGIQNAMNTPDEVELNIITAEQKDAEHAQTFAPDSSHGRDRYFGAAKLFVLAKDLENEMVLENAAKHLRTARHYDPALSGSKKLLDSLNALDEDLNARHRGSLFSHSSTEHDELKKSVEALKTALDQKNLADARRQKLDALITARDKARKYVEQKRKDAGADINDDQWQPDSKTRMGRRRYNAAMQILKLTEAEIAVVENAINVKRDPRTDFDQWTFANRASNEAGENKKNDLGTDSLIYRERAEEYERINDLSVQLDDLKGSLYGIGSNNTTDENSPVGNKLDALLKSAREANSWRREDWIEHHAKVKRYFDLINNEKDLRELFRACDRADTAAAPGHANALISFLELANKHISELDIDHVKEVHRKYELDMSAIDKAHAEKLEKWREAYPFSANRYVFRELNDPKLEKRVIEINNAEKAALRLTNGELASLFGRITDNETSERFVSVMNDLDNLFMTGKDLNKKENLEAWKRSGRTIQELKELLTTGDNYARLCIAADRLDKQRGYKTGFIEDLDSLIKVLNTHLDAGIDMNPLKQKYYEYTTVSIGAERFADLDNEVNIEMIRQNMERDGAFIEEYNDQFTGPVVGDQAKQSMVGQIDDIMKKYDNNIIIDDNKSVFSDGSEINTNRINNDAKSVKSNNSDDSFDDNESDLNFEEQMMHDIKKLEKEENKRKQAGIEEPKAPLNYDDDFWGEKYDKVQADYEEHMKQPVDLNEQLKNARSELEYFSKNHDTKTCQFLDIYDPVKVIAAVNYVKNDPDRTYTNRDFKNLTESMPREFYRLNDLNGEKLYYASMDGDGSKLYDILMDEKTKLPVETNVKINNSIDYIKGKSNYKYNQYPSFNSVKDELNVLIAANYVKKDVGKSYNDEAFAKLVQDLGNEPGFAALKTAYNQKDLYDLAVQKNGEGLFNAVFPNFKPEIVHNEPKAQAQPIVNKADNNIINAEPIAKAKIDENAPVDLDARLKEAQNGIQQLENTVEQIESENVDKEFRVIISANFAKKNPDKKFTNKEFDNLVNSMSSKEEYNKMLRLNSCDQLTRMAKKDDGRLLMDSMFKLKPKEKKVKKTKAEKPEDKEIVKNNDNKSSRSSSRKNSFANVK